MKSKMNKNLSDKGIVIEELKEFQHKIYAFDFINGAGASGITGGCCRIGSKA